MAQAHINEIFVSIQGEGPWVGERHIFVRFQGCDLHCKYCDTPASRAIPTDPHAVLSARELTERCQSLVIPGPGRPTISVTGGEPLLQTGFLLEWLPTVRERFRVFLETNGVRAVEMATVQGLIDVVSMDIKLPSSAGPPPLWQQHREFLAACRENELAVKLIVTRDAATDEVLASCRLLSGRGRPAPLILQPASGLAAPPADRLIELQALALTLLPDVRVIPQVHKLLQVP
jgi:organic radical activating enzyme